MRRVATLLTTAAVVLFMAGLSAQGKTDFSGKWTPDAEKNAANAPAGGGGGGGNRGGGGGGGAMTITQDAKTLKIETTGQNGAQTQTFNLDGSPSKNTMGQNESTSTAKWDGANLVVTTTVSMNGNDRVTTTTYSIDGGELVRASTQPGRNGGEPTTRKTYFKKG